MLSRSFKTFIFLAHINSSSPWMSNPNYANLYVGFVEKQIFEQCTDPTPDYFGRYIDDCGGTVSYSRGELEQFINYVNNFHPALQFTLEISESSVSFLDILVSVNGNRLVTSVFYKPTDPLSYLVYSSSHPNHTKRSIGSFVFTAYMQFGNERSLCPTRLFQFCFRQGLRNFPI